MSFQSKKQYFTFLSGREQSDITKRLVLLAKASQGEEISELLGDWIEEERDLVAGGLSFRPWIEAHLDDDRFWREAERFLNFELRQQQFKQVQKDRQKAYRMKDPATPKQVKYLKNLLKKHGKSLEHPLESLTKGEMSDWIEKLTEEERPA